MTNRYLGLELLATAVLLLGRDLSLRYTNPAAENLLAFSRGAVVGSTLPQSCQDASALMAACDKALLHNCSYTEYDVTVVLLNGSVVQVSLTVTPVDEPDVTLVVEMRPIAQQLKIAREERMRYQQQANRELIRNLAHEIKNPLGGIRGAAQLLERELDRPEFAEYTQVIIEEADRLQKLMDRLLTPHRLPQVGSVNIHEVLERVRSLMLAEMPNTLSIRRDYDTSLPDLHGDKSQLIQAVLNIVRNAAQALQGRGEIILRTRAVRQVTLAKKRHRLAIQLDIIDNGPGIPEPIRERIFDPLISGRSGGTGLGLTLAQTFVHQHQGTLECDSRPGYTCFTLLLPAGHLSSHSSETKTITTGQPL